MSVDVVFLITDGAGNPYLASVRKDVKTYSNRWLEYANILNKHAILAIVTNSNHQVKTGGFVFAKPQKKGRTEI